MRNPEHDEWNARYFRDIGPLIDAEDAAFQAILDYELRHRVDNAWDISPERKALFAAHKEAERSMREASEQWLRDNPEPPFVWEPPGEMSDVIAEAHTEYLRDLRAEARDMEREHDCLKDAR